MLELHPKLHHLAALAHSSNRDGDGFKVAELLQSGYNNSDIIGGLPTRGPLFRSRLADIRHGRISDLQLHLPNRGTALGFESD